MKKYTAQFLFTAITIATLFASLASPVFADEVFDEDHLTQISVNMQPTNLKLSNFYQFPIQKTEFNGLSQKFSRFHPGFDIRAKLHAEVKPIQAGTVTTIGYERGGYGKYVIVRHENGIESLYAHLDTTKVKEGDAVSLLTIIGTVGLTGHTTGSHIHFEIRADGARISPESILPVLN